MSRETSSIHNLWLAHSLRRLIFIALISLFCLAIALPAHAADHQNGIAAPAEGAAVSGVVAVQGVAAHPAFRKWQLDLLMNGDPVQATFLALGEQPVTERSALANWDTTLYPNGSHTLRLRVVHTNLNYDEYFTPVVIRNASVATPDVATAGPATEISVGESSAETTPATEAARSAEQKPDVITGAVFRDDVPLRGERRIVVDLSDQTLTAWQGDEVVFQTSVSTGKQGWLTLPGTFQIQRKYEKTRMRGPGYDTPDVPWTMYYDGAFAIHGAYWHNNFGTPVSHGCVNLRVEEAKTLYQWASEGDTVVVNR